MKKHFLIAAALAAGTLITQKAQAQLALENFNSGSLPANWVLISDGHTVNNSFTGVAAIRTALNASAWTPYQVVATGDYSMITTSYFNPAATADRWLITPSFTVTSANTIFKWDDDDLGSGENIQVLVSPTAGTTAASFTTTIVDQPAGGGAGSTTTHAVSLSAYNGQTIRMAFRDHVNDGWGLIVDNVLTAIQPNATDVALTSIAPASGSAFVYGGAGSARTISGVITNNGAQALSSFTIQYKQGSNAAVSQTFTPSAPIQPLASGSFTFTTPLTIPSTGTFPVKVWAAQSGDAVHTNDTLATTLIGIDSLQPRMVLFEEFTGASCDPCANAAPNVDSVVYNNLSRMNAIRYHVPIPARDLLYNASKASVDPRMTFYGINSAPSGRIGGVDQYPGRGYFTSEVVAREQSAGAPFKITGSATFDANTKTFNVSSNIKSYANFAASTLNAYIALTVDTITYTSNISLESLPQTEFPQVVEYMFPAAGTPLAAFTPGQTQTVTSSWVKNHAWGDKTGGFAYDSTKTGKITMWVQDKNSKVAYQSLSLSLSNISSLSVTNLIGNNGSIEIYPNPAVSASTVRFELKESANINIEVVDMTGRTVKTVANERMNAGTQQVTIPVTDLASGVYNVRLSTKEGTVTQRLNVIK